MELVGLSFCFHAKVLEGSAFRSAPAARSPVPNPSLGLGSYKAWGTAWEKAPGCSSGSEPTKVTLFSREKVLKCSGLCPEVG